MEPHIPPQGHQLPVRLLPGPASGLVGAGGQDAVLFLRVHQADLTVVRLGGQVHGLKDALGAGHGSQQEVALLGELVDGHGRLPHKDQVTGQAADIGHAGQGHQAPPPTATMA